jgi:tetratricopeptide (TPR) repeat protein
MKKLVLTLFTVAMAAGSTFAQVDKALVEAQKKAILDAVKKTDEAVKKTPIKPKPWLERAVAYLDLASFPDSTLALKDADAPFKALEYIAEAVKLDTKDGKKGSTAKEAEVLLTGRDKAYGALMNMGVIKYQGKNYAGSYRYMSKASEISPNDTTSAMYTGVVAQLCQKDAEAKLAYEHYLKIGGKDMAIMYGLSQIYKVAKEEDKSLAIIDQAMVIYPNNKDLKNEKFNMLISFNRIDQAITQLKATVAADPKDAMSWLNIGLLYENKMNGVLDEVRKIQDKTVKTSEAKRKLAAQKDQVEVYLDEVKRTKAKLKTTPPAKQAPIKAQVAKLESTLAEQTKALDGLKADLTKAEAEVGDEATNKAKIEELSAKVAEFRKDLPGFYTKALEVNENYYDALYQLGAYYFNEAVEIKKKVDNMDMETYKKEGKNVEAAVTSKYEQALPYFEKGFKVKKEDDLKEVLKQIYRALKLDAKLAELEK